MAKIKKITLTILIDEDGNVEVDVPKKIEVVEKHKPPKGAAVIHLDRGGPPDKGGG